MTKTRASIFGEGEGGLDLSGFAPKAARDIQAPPADAIRAVSEAARFPSREAKPAPAITAPPPPARREQRRHRTGRNVQFNIRARQETIDTFLAIADREGWVLGEVLEHAIAALERELASQNKS
ncbi:stability/partitioning determinant [Niveispirillum cyanobacteriorum]|uniref:Stability/partitioning determinant n=1 Tax=Niveispirillum cyanobacteriorum TaxID=1612173 RepID=A0A2K9NLH8_9PROT|nr:stability/partitioning determinant [Niveispirillum cyanobacteriorum]AUN33929.1 stability/partitioning determinant [Niveispirillum cyanobacteriorum]GGE86138.1 hypothetical protein GCM10011317_49110 [Niveispirillum cyanobacteriorum]